MAAAGLNTSLEVAEAVNHTSPVELTQRFLSGAKTTEDGLSRTVIYAASHSSHLWDDESIPRLPGYEQVGPTKRKGETALRSLLGSEEANSSTRAIIVSGDLLTDTIVASMLAKAAGMSPQEYTDSRDKVISKAIGRPGTGTIEYGQTIGRAFDNQQLGSGHTIYVPRPVFELPDRSGAMVPQALGNDRLAQMGPTFSIVG